jgi:hypothetical protein
MTQPPEVAQVLPLTVAIDARHRIIHGPLLIANAKLDIPR